MIGILGPTFPYTSTGFDLIQLFRKFTKAPKDDSRTGYSLLYGTLESYSHSWMEHYNSYYPTRRDSKSQNIKKPDPITAPITQISSEDKSDSENNKTKQPVGEESNAWSAFDLNSVSYDLLIFVSSMLQMFSIVI